MNATITATPARRRPTGLEAHLPRHIRHDAPEMLAADRVLAKVLTAFRSYGINSPVNAPGQAELADVIAQALGTADTARPVPAPPEPLTDAEADELIGN